MKGDFDCAFIFHRFKLNKAYEGIVVPLVFMSMVYVIGSVLLLLFNRFQVRGRVQTLG